jgi:DNA topoisomerase-3
MKLIIAEKPAVSRAIASVLGVKKREDGYMEGNGYLVSWCFGHLAELADADAYDEKYAKWRYEDLPVMPNPWQYTVSRDKKKQLDLLCSLMKRNDVTEVINACDAGREGELIFRTVYKLSGCKKPMKRLWISSMEDAAILDGFNNLRDGAEYDSLYESALCRSKADWLVGINATRLFSVLYHRTLNVGRVVSPTLALLVQREAEIGAFKPEPFYTVNLDFGDFNAAGEKLADTKEANASADDCRNNAALVVAVERKDKSEKAPALYDLTTLQRDATRILGYTAQQTLDYLQSLYEKKLTTYPRTDSRFLTDDMEDSVRAAVLCAAGIMGAAAPVVINPAQVCDSKKVSDHSAVIPTIVAGETDLAALPAGEREVLLLISRQVLMAVSEAYRYTETAVTLECGGHSFTAKGRTVTIPGWKEYLSQEQKDKTLPELAEGDMLTPADVSVKEGATTPPKHYTEDTLLSAMETAGVKDMPEDAERKGLGTPATRAAILEKLVSAGLVERRKSKKTVNLIPSDGGVSLITVLPEQLQSPLLTAEWEQKLKQVEHGELAADAFLAEISDMVSELIKGYEVIKGAKVLFPSGRTVVGKCPRCGSNVTESKKGYFCERSDCKFGLWRDNKFLTAKKINLTKKMASSLLTDRRTYASGIYSEKTGKNYDAYIVLEDDGIRSSYKLDFTKEGN